MVDRDNMKRDNRYLVNLFHKLIDVHRDTSLIMICNSSRRNTKVDLPDFIALLLATNIKVGSIEPNKELFLLYNEL